MEKEIKEFLKNNDITFNGDRIIDFSNEGDVLKFYKKKKIPLIITVDNTEDEGLNHFMKKLEKENEKAPIVVLHSLLVDDMIEVHEVGSKESLPLYILQDLREAIGVDSTDSSKDAEIAQWSISKKVKVYLEWNCAIGLSKNVLDIIKFELCEDIKLQSNHLDKEDVDSHICLGKTKEFIYSKI